ncbi:MAG: hypothetical protein ACR2QR_09525 [Woeseiaceae bacterium]
MKSSTSLPARQSGAALLLMMLVVIVGAAAVLVTKLNRNTTQISATAKTGLALAQAREALVAYALSFPDRVPGSAVQLPCPDLDDTGTTLDGESHTANCGAPGVSVLGRLPWKTLGIAAPRDSASECLWYVVSGDHKSAGIGTAPLLNPDTNGQLTLYQADSGTLIEGSQPEDRPIALIFAAGQALSGQSRQAISQSDQQCSSDFSIAAFLDSDPGTGVSNSTLIGVPGIDSFVRAAGESMAINDRVVSISREDLANLVYNRHDHELRMRGLAAAVAACLANYGNSNPGGANDLRLPWPAAVSMPDYRLDALYDDVAGGVLSGRLADTVDDSNGLTGNTFARVLSDCDTGAVPAWNAEMLSLWQNWKDHFFYYVSDSFNPAAAVPSTCVDCVSVNGGAQVAAVVLYSHRRLDALSQRRDAPPLDVDTRDDINNYLESVNSGNHPYVAGNVDLESRAADLSFNDILYCIDTAMGVAAC